MPLFLIRLTPVRPDFLMTATDAEKGLVGAHFQYLKSLLESDILHFAGRTNEAEPSGYALIEAPDLARASQMMEADPAIRGGVFKGQVAPYSFALASDRTFASLVE